MKKKGFKVLLTINNLDTAGMKYVLADIAEGLNKQEFQVAIGVTRKSGSLLEQRLEKQFSIEVLPLRLTNSSYLGFPFRLMRLLWILRGENDVVHSFDYSSDWLEALASKILFIPFVAEKTNLIYAEKKWQKKLNWSSYIIALSNAQADQLKSFSQKLSVIPTGIDIVRFEKSQALDRRDFGITDDKVIAISVAHLVDVKGYEELISALKEVKNDFPQLLVLAVGKGEKDYESYLNQKVMEAGVSDMIWFIGESDRVPELLKMADFKILSTQNRGRREGFGAAIVEAMAAGLPVLATKSGGPEDIVVDGKTGWLIPGDGVEYLVMGLKRVFREKENWIEFGQNGLKRVKEKYSKNKMVDQYSRVYKSLLKKEL